jgi:hypothetical protein
MAALTTGVDRRVYDMYQAECQFRISWYGGEHATMT